MHGSTDQNSKLQKERTLTDGVTMLITGGAGFLGYHCAQGLHTRGVKSILADVVPYQESDYPQGTLFENADTRDQAAIESILRRHSVAAVIHAAAALPLAPRNQIYDVNLNGTRNVLDCALRCGVPRVVFIGSTAVYGVPKKHPIEEDDPLVGVGPYGHTKIEGERICADYRARGLCVPIVRPKTFVGTGRLGVFQILYDWVESGCRIPMIGDGENRYQLLEVEDLVDAIYRCATMDAKLANDTFNVGTRDFATVREDLQELCDYAGSGARPMGTPAWLVKPILAVFEAVKISPLYKWVYGTADKDSYVSTERIERSLGWRAQYSNGKALIRSYQWYLEHKVESDAATGITHRVAWSQGILKVFKTLLR